MREIVTLAVEEPMEIRADGRSYAVILRTPGDDMDLAAGYLVSEGAVWHRDHVPEICYCTTVSGKSEQDFNTLTVTLSPDIPEPEPAGSPAMTGVCGVSGTDSIGEVDAGAHFQAEPVMPLVGSEVLLSLNDRLGERRVLSGRTGGVDAAGLFSPSGELLCLREDVSRRNAVDKVVGWALREGRLPLRGSILQVTGAVCFDLVRRTAMAGIPVLAGTAAPSSLAVELAAGAGITLAVVDPGGGGALYAHSGRVEA